MRAQDELKPCPFCGGEAELAGFNAPEFWVWCPSCKASTAAHTGKQSAIEAWNTRAERTCHAVASKTKTGRSHTCSICGGMIRTTSTNDNYCPNCGARVIGE